MHICYVAQLYPTLWDPMDGSLPGSSVHGIPQARTAEWVAGTNHAWALSHIRLLAMSWTIVYQAPLSTGFSRQTYWGGLQEQIVLGHSVIPTPWTIARQAPLSMGFSRREYCIGLPFPPAGKLPDPEIRLTPPVSPALAGGFFAAAPPGKPKTQPYNESCEQAATSEH